MALNDLQLAGSTLYYLYGLFGSVSFGYLVLRLGYPDARVFSDEEKLGASALVGFLMFMIAVVLDVVVSGVDRVAVASGFSASAFLVVMIFFMVAFKLYFSSNPVETRTVAVPLSSDDVLTKVASKMTEQNLVLASQVMPSVTDSAGGMPKIEDITIEASGKTRDADSLTPVPVPKELVKKSEGKAFVKQEEKYAAPAVQPKKGELRLEDLLKDEVLNALKQEQPPANVEAAMPEANPNQIREKLSQLKAKGIIPAEGSTPVQTQDATPSKISRREEQVRPLVRENVRESERLKQRLQDTEAETVLKDISEGDVLQQAKRHRLYLNPQAAAQRRTQAPDDPTEFAKDVYSRDNQERRPEERQRDRAARREEQKKPTTQPQQAGPKEISMKDLFGETPGAPAAEQKESSPLFAQLNAISTKKEQPIQQSVDVKLAPKTVAGCPTCNAKTSRIVFCPYCGTGMCANCSPAIKPAEDGFVYSCPKCSEEVFVRKQSKQGQPPEGQMQNLNL